MLRSLVEGRLLDSPPWTESRCLRLDRCCNRSMGTAIHQGCLILVLKTHRPTCYPALHALAAGYLDQVCPIRMRKHLSQPISGKEEELEFRQAGGSSHVNTQVFVYLVQVAVQDLTATTVPLSTDCAPGGTWLRLRPHPVRQTRRVSGSF